jgi:hypothetical protein
MLPGRLYDGLTMLRIHPVVGHAWRASCRIAARLWYESPVALLVAYVCLAAAAVALARSAGLELKPGGFGSVLLLAFWCWRVSRGGSVSRGILIYVSVLELLTAAQLAQSWHIQTVAVFATGLAALMLLLSPAVYARTHPGSAPASSSMRLRPRPWMVLAAPLAGTAVAGLTLAVTRRWFLPGSGCMIGPVEALPQHCVGAGRGFPAPVVATVHGARAVSQLAFAQDCIQWTVVIFTVSYLLWLVRRRRHPSVTERLPAGGLVAERSQ